MVHVNETLQCDFEKGHLLLLGCFPDHFASIICRVLTSRSAFSAVIGKDLGKALANNVKRLVVILCVDTGFHSVLLILALAVPVEELFPTGAGESVAFSALFLFL